MKFSKYVIIKALPDASIGTVVVWDEEAWAYKYAKDLWVSPHKFNFLGDLQVEENKEYFLELNELQP